MIWFGDGGHKVLMVVSSYIQVKIHTEHRGQSTEKVHSLHFE